MPTPEELAADATEETPEASAGLNVLVSRMVELKAQLDAIDTHRKAVQQDYDQLRKRLIPDALNDNGLTGAKTPLGTLSIRSRSWATVPAARQHVAVGWCQGQGLDEFVGIEPSKALALYKALVADGRPIPDFINVFTEETAVLTRKKE